MRISDWSSDVCSSDLRPDGAGPEAIDRINARIQAQLVATGEIALSPTTLDGRYSLRVCLVNFRTRRADIDWLVERVLAFGREAGRTGRTPRLRPRRQEDARPAIGTTSCPQRVGQHG